MALVVRQTTSGQAWVAQPNRGLSALQVRCLMLAAAGVSGSVAFVFIVFGAWPAIPFAGLEVFALWLVLVIVRRHADDEESLEITPHQVLLTRRIAGCCEEIAFSRYWARLRVDQPPDRRRGRVRLFLRSHGRETEIGRLLTEAQKEELAGELRAKLGATD